MTRNTKALILDSDMGARTVLSMSFEFQGYSCLPVDSIAAALHIVEQGQPDIIVLGYSLSATETARFIEALHEVVRNRPAPKILVLGAFRREEIRPEIRRHGLAHIIVKSYQSHLTTQSADKALRACA